MRYSALTAQNFIARRSSGTNCQFFYDVVGSGGLVWNGVERASVIFCQRIVNLYDHKYASHSVFERPKTQALGVII